MAAADHFSLIRYAIYFIIGGIVTVTIVGFEEFGSPLISRLAAIFPVFTWLAYLIIGQLGSGKDVAQHATFVLFGTIVSWIPYMATIIWLSPKIGVQRAVLCAIGVFLIMAFIFIYAYPHITGTRL